jgi:hypothetical protein
LFEIPGKVCQGFFCEDELMKRERQKSVQRVITLLNRNEVDFLDRIGKDALFSTGFKLSRAKLIAWLVDFAERLKIDGRGIKSQKDLEERIIKMLKAQNREESQALTTSNEAE